MDPYFYLVIFAGLIAGASTGLLGVYVVGMRIPFIGICISHAAMAGFIFGSLLAFASPILAVASPSVGGIAASVIGALALAAIRPGKTRLDTNVALAIVFNYMLGLAFLGMGLNRGSRSEMLGLLWGNILFVDQARTLVITVMAGVLIIFCLLFNNELKVLLFSRTMASASGMHEGFVYGLFLTVCAITLSVNLPLIGGLMIFSLITCPAAAAYQICTGHKRVVFTATVLGMLSALAGFLVSYYLNLPTGACIVIVSATVFGLAATYRAVLRRAD